MREREEKPRNVKNKGELPVLEMVVITNMEPFHLSVCWSVKRQKDFKLADLYGFLKWSINMPPVDVLLVEEFGRKGVSMLCLSSFGKTVLYFCVLKLQNYTFCTWI